MAQKSSAARWRRGQLYASTQAEHKWEARAVFMQCLAELHPGFVSAVVDRFGPPIERLCIERSPSHPSDFVEGVVAGSVQDKNAREVIAPLDEHLEEHRLLGVVWVRRWVLDLVAQNANAVQMGEQRGRHFWAACGQSGYGTEERFGEPDFIYLEEGAQLPKDWCTRPDDPRQQREVFAWNPMWETLDSFRRRIDEHIKSRQAWARANELSPLPVGIQPNDRGVWVADTGFRRNMGWVVRRQVDEWSVTEICRRESRRGEEPRRLVQRETTQLARYIGLRFG